MNGGAVGVGKGGQEGLQKGMKKFGGSNRYSHYLACGDGFMDVYMSKFTKLHTLNMYRLLYVNYTSVKPIYFKA